MIEISGKIREKLEEFTIPEGMGIGYLLCLYFNLDSHIYPVNLKTQINAIGIVTFLQGQGLTWLIPLFKEEVAEVDNTNWVKTRYIPMFKAKKPTCGTHLKDCLVRLKSFFKEHQCSIEEVLGATELYLTNTDKKYVREPHYFISKGRGVDKTSDLVAWLEKYQEGAKISSYSKTLIK